MPVQFLLVSSSVFKSKVQLGRATACQKLQNNDSLDEIDFGADGN